MADILAPNYRRRTKLQQPNYTRSRAAYRSPMDSERMNLAAEQLRFDLTNLRLQAENLKTLLNQQLDINTAGSIFNIDPTDPSYALFPGTASNSLSTPSASVPVVLGDITIVARVALTDWTPTAINTIVAKWSGASQNCYLFRVNTNGSLSLAWSNDGIAVSGNVSSTVLGVTDGAWKWVAATLDIDDGAGNRVVRFWTSNNGITWTIVGSPSTTAGITSIFGGTRNLYIGSQSDGTIEPFAGKINYVSVRNGIGAGGTVGGNEVFRFNADTDITDTSATTLTASTGQTMTVNKSAPATSNTTLKNNSYRSLLGIPALASKVKALREQVRRLEIEKGIYT